MRRSLLILTVCVLIFLVVQPARAQESPLNVFYSGPEGSVRTALELAKFNFVSDPNLADVLVFNGEIPAVPLPPEAGIVLILGDGLDQADVVDLLGIPVTLESRSEPTSPTAIKGLDEPLLSEIQWNSAPQVHERSTTLTSVSSVQPLVVGFEDGEWLLWHSAGKQHFVFTAFLDGANTQFQEWPYYNYLIYYLVESAAGNLPASFADYSASPVPHMRERNILIALLGLILLTSFGAFFFVRRYSMQHPEALEKIVSERELFQKREAETEWSQVGFHRPLSGLFVGMTIGALLFIPLIIYQNLILPQFILPSAQAMGIWGRVTQFFGMTWALFDLGTAIAGMKYLSQYRVTDPKRGIQYQQLFVWWQVLSGAIQVALVVLLASTGLVRSAYALYAWSIIVHTFIQIPGFYGVMRNTLNAFQRNDYARYLDQIGSMIMPMIMQPIFIGLFYYWGKQTPSIGPALGGVIGLGVAAYASELFTFLVGYWMYRRLGYNTQIIFLAHFDWKVAKESFSFGIFEMAGGLIATIGSAAEIWITQGRLVNYTEIWGNWVLAQNFIFAFTVATNLYDGVMPAVSEAISHGRRKLSQYYSVQSYKWGAVSSAFLAAILLVVAPRFIIGSSGEDFKRAALYSVPLIIWGSMQYLSWTGDAILLGANKPRIRAALIFMEQSIRILLSLILIERLQVVGLIIAYFIGLLTKGIIVYFIDHRFAFPQRFFFWQSAAAPFLAGAFHFLLLDGLARLIWQGDEITSILLFFIALLPSLPVFMFLYSLFGGWDQKTLAELREAVELTGAMRPIARYLYWKPAELAARFSPLHNRFPITIYDAAIAEAHTLTDESVKL